MYKCALDVDILLDKDDFKNDILYEFYNMYARL